MRFIKCHAYGNDFLLVDEQDTRGHDDLPALARQLCSRHRGVGADGVMLFSPTPDGARMRLFNADGSSSELSGNGVRCLAAWIARDRELTAGAQVVVHTDAGEKPLSLLEVDGRKYRFRAAMGHPEDLRQERITLHGANLDAVVLRVGNPQCIILGPVTPERLTSIAGPLAVHPFFPEGTNVELVTVESPERIRILIWERGVGPTEASGTGACASAVAAAAFGGAGRDVEVISPGGAQRVEWTPEGIWLTGAAEIIATGAWA